METVVVAGVFALIGAALGSVLTGVVQGILRGRNARADRLDAAIRSVAIALAAQHFTWSVGMSGAPDNVTAEDEAESARAMYLKGIERYMTALHEAKRELAIVAVDGVSIGMPIGMLDEDLGRALPEVFDHLMKYRGAKRRR